MYSKCCVHDLYLCMVVCIANLVYATASVILLTLDNLWIGWKCVTNFSEMTSTPAYMNISKWQTLS